MVQNTILDSAQTDCFWKNHYSEVVRSFRQKTGVYSENSRYFLTTAMNSTELRDVFRLRQQAFFGKSASGQEVLDVDSFDLEFDHLVIREKATGEVCGTYRIASQDMVESFYSSSEFDIDRILRTPGEKVEVGRACVHEDHRNGLVIDLLWRGIGQYALRSKATMIFGLSSVKSTCSILARQMAQYFVDRGMANASYGMEPHPDFRPATQCDRRAAYSEECVESLVPPLIQSYLRAGAQLNPFPAVDSAFGSIDFLTILEVDKMHSGYKRRYLA
jgi:putative hemolysin